MGGKLGRWDSSIPGGGAHPHGVIAACWITQNYDSIIQASAAAGYCQHGIRGWPGGSTAQELADVGGSDQLEGDV